MYRVLHRTFRYAFPRAFIQRTCNCVYELNGSSPQLRVSAIEFSMIEELVRLTLTSAPRVSYCVPTYAYTSTFLLVFVYENGLIKIHFVQVLFTNMRVCARSLLILIYVQEYSLMSLECTLVFAAACVRQ